MLTSRICTRWEIQEKDDMELLENFAKQLDIIAEGYKAQSVR